MKINSIQHDTTLKQGNIRLHSESHNFREKNSAGLYEKDRGYNNNVYCGSFTGKSKPATTVLKKGLFDKILSSGWFGRLAKYAEEHNLAVVRELVGHGVGNDVHEDPDVPNYGARHTGPVLKEGMVIAVEPMLNLGTRKIYILDDDWTIITADGKPSAHFEHTVLVTKKGHEILTRR